MCRHIFPPAARPYDGCLSRLASSGHRAGRCGGGVAGASSLPVRRPSTRVRRALQGMSPAGATDLVHGLDVDVPLRRRALDRDDRARPGRVRRSRGRATVCVPQASASWWRTQSGPPTPSSPCPTSPPNGSLPARAAALWSCMKRPGPDMYPAPAEEIESCRRRYRLPERFVLYHLVRRLRSPQGSRGSCGGLPDGGPGARGGGRNTSGWGRRSEPWRWGTSRLPTCGRSTDRGHRVRLPVAVRGSRSAAARSHGLRRPRRGQRHRSPGRSARRCGPVGPGRSTGQRGPGRSRSSSPTPLRTPPWPRLGASGRPSSAGPTRHDQRWMSTTSWVSTERGGQGAHAAP